LQGFAVGKPNGAHQPHLNNQIATQFCVAFAVFAAVVTYRHIAPSKPPVDAQHQLQLLQLLQHFPQMPPPSPPPNNARHRRRFLNTLIDLGVFGVLAVQMYFSALSASLRFKITPVSRSP
jgi:hypothetical protein